MLLTIQNEQIRLSAETKGAQLMSIRSVDGTEYLWQGNPDYWSDRAPTLFPFIGRLTNDSYRYHGQVYRMGIHGFAASSEFVPVEHTDTRLVMEMRENAHTLVQYPFAFVLRICWELKENSVCVSYHVENHSGATMPFGIGGHPGFRVPLAEGERFEDYRLEFSQNCEPDRVGFTPDVYMNGQDSRYVLREGRKLALHHDLFREDAIILKNMDRQVTLCSDVSRRKVVINYPDMPYLGIWHWPCTDAPYVCIEPWSSLPARQDVVEELSCKSDMIQLAPGKAYDNSWTITVF